MMGYTCKCIFIFSCSHDSLRYSNYEKFCGYGNGVSLCPEGPAMCRNAMISVMGTILTTNCTCLLNDPEENKECQDIAWKLHGESSCKRKAFSNIMFL